MYRLHMPLFLMRCLTWVCQNGHWLMIHLSIHASSHACIQSITHWLVTMKSSWALSNCIEQFSFQSSEMAVPEDRVPCMHAKDCAGLIQVMGSTCASSCTLVSESSDTLPCSTAWRVPIEDGLDSSSDSISSNLACCSWLCFRVSLDSASAA